MEKQVLMHKLFRGNFELALFVHAASDKSFAQKFVGDLYHFMAGISESPITDAKVLGEYLMLLRDIASETNDLSLNEFLGSVDMMAERLYEGY